MKVILELYLEIWHCYASGHGMNDALFTSCEYEEAINECLERGYEIIQIIDI